jgi:hypothetical protein
LERRSPDALVEPGPNVGGRIATLFTLTWVPLACLCALQGVLFGHKVSLPLLYDFSVYGRYFVGLPVLVIAEVVIRICWVGWGLCWTRSGISEFCLPELAASLPVAMVIPSRILACLWAAGRYRCLCL